MTTAFLDTTIVVDRVLKSSSAAGAAARAKMATFDDCQIPWYAIKEFEAGAFCGFIYGHNLLHKFPLTEALAHCTQLLQRNKARTAAQAINAATASMDGSFSAVRGAAGGAPVTVMEAMRRNVRVHLKRNIIKAWKSVRALPATYVDPLRCLRDATPPKEQPRTGLIEFATKRCQEDVQCGAAELVARSKGGKAVLRIVRDAIDRQNKAAPKAEHANRLVVIRGLISQPGKTLPDSACRQLGDAVIAICSPASAVILTTNVNDFVPLAEALGKRVESP